MKSFKNIALTAALTLGAFSLVTYTACNKDECKDVVCQNLGTCSGGNCICTTGYEGSRCETATRAKFIKTWTATDTEVGGTALPAYSPIVTAGSSILEVKISKFSDDFFTNEVKATVDGNSIIIPSQEPDADGYKVSGTGTYNPADKSISWTYTLTNPSNQDLSYTGTWN